MLNAFVRFVRPPM